MKSITYLFIFFSFLLFSCAQKANDDASKEDSSKNSGTSVSGQSELPMVDIFSISKMTKAELRIARNTVYAKYGRIFKSADLKAHFSQLSWYNENPRFKESDLSEGDRRIVKMIRLWEDKTKVLWSEQLDMTGNGTFEECYVLYNEGTHKFAVLINDYSEEFDHYWGQSDDNEAPPSDWESIHIEAIDIISDDYRQEIHIHQRFHDWEDPGTENLIVTFDSEMHISNLSSSDYDAGVLTFKDGQVTMQVSNCPEHTRDYRLEYGKLVSFDEQKLPPPPGGCAACFTGDTQIATSITSSKPISELKRNDEVLSYNIVTEKLETTTVLRVLEVYHDELFELSFGESTLKLTADHPIYVSGKGWASLAPDQTKKRYANYSEINLLEEGDLVQFANGMSAPIYKIEMLDSGHTTFTVESLKNGQSIIVNGIVAGTEMRATPLP